LKNAMCAECAAFGGTNIFVKFVTWHVDGLSDRAVARKSGQNVPTNCMGKASRGAA
jgi:hypothetical protein